MRAKFGRGPMAVSKKVSFNFISRCLDKLLLCFRPSKAMGNRRIRWVCVPCIVVTIEVDSFLWFVNTLTISIHDKLGRKM